MVHGRVAPRAAAVSGASSPTASHGSHGGFPATFTQTPSTAQPSVGRGSWGQPHSWNWGDLDSQVRWVLGTSAGGSLPGAQRWTCVVPVGPGEVPEHQDPSAPAPVCTAGAVHSQPTAGPRWSLLTSQGTKELVCEEGANPHLSPSVGAVPGLPGPRSPRPSVSPVEWLSRDSAKAAGSSPEAPSWQQPRVPQGLGQHPRGLCGGGRPRPGVQPLWSPLGAP